MSGPERPTADDPRFVGYRRRLIEDIRARGPLPALVVCHGGPIRAVLCRRHGTGLSAFHTWEVPNAAVVRV